MKYDDVNDPKGLIYEAYRIEGISKSECRTIFLDWVLSLPMDKDTNLAIKEQMAKYAHSSQKHPMDEVFDEGLQEMSKPRRRGGWRSRNRPQ